ncbi:hypothetical protein FDUTEX481_00857 [Tolypothrix sp. PCC 7601]|nr:hypothetical protein FDUTEX481_00857 [Tolypothrix sp. PCC 7601]
MLNQLVANTCRLRVKRGMGKGKEKTFNLFPKINFEFKMLSLVVLNW